MYVDSENFELILTDKDIDCFVTVNEENNLLKLRLLTDYNDVEDRLVSSILDKKNVKINEVIESELNISFMNDLDICVRGIDSYISLEGSSKKFLLKIGEKLGFSLYKATIPKGSRIVKVKYEKDSEDYAHYCSNKIILKEKENESN